MLLDTSWLNTQHYKERIEGKVEQSRERSSVPQYLGVVAIEKGAFGSPTITTPTVIILIFISSNSNRSCTIAIIKANSFELMLYPIYDTIVPITDHFLISIFFWQRRINSDTLFMKAMSGEPKREYTEKSAFEKRKQLTQDFREAI